MLGDQKSRPWEMPWSWRGPPAMLNLTRASVPMATPICLHQRGVEGGGQADRFGKDGGIAVARHAMQRLAPPVIGGNAQARDGAGLVDHLRGFLAQRHLRDQGIDALLGRQVGIEPGLLVLRRGA